MYKKKLSKTIDNYYKLIYIGVNLLLFNLYLMFKKYTFIIGLVGALIVAGCVSSNSVETSQLPETIKIGFIGPLTGGMAAYGHDIKIGVSAYFNEHPTIDGKKVEIIFEDGRCDGQTGASVAQKLITVDKVQAILGGLCSSETLAAAPIAEQSKVILISAASSSPEVSTAGDYTFRNYPSDEQVAKTMVDYVIAHHNTIALLSEQSDYAQAYRSAIKKHLNSMGKISDLVVDEAYSLDNTDFRTLLAKVKKSKADTLIALVQAPVTGGFIAKQAKEMGLDIQIYSGDTLPGPDFFATAKDAAEGVRVVMATEDPTRDGYATLMKKIETPQVSGFFPALGYDAAALLTQGIEKAGYNGTAIKNYFYKMPFFKGVASNVSFDSNGDNSIDAGVKEVKNGEFVRISN